jgi:hypothetical protein
VRVRINWTYQSDYDDGKDQTGVSQDGLDYVIRRISKGLYEALVGAPDGERIELGKHMAAYWACVNHNWDRQTPEAQATRRRMPRTESQKQAFRAEVRSWACVDGNWDRQPPEVQEGRHGNVEQDPQPEPPPMCPECWTEHNGECA